MVFLLLQLAYCVVQFLEKDPTLTEPVFIYFFLSLLLKSQGLRLLISIWCIENNAHSHPQKQTAAVLKWISCHVCR